MKKFFYIALVGMTAFIFWLWPDGQGNYPVPFITYLGQVFEETITPEDLKDAYNENKLKILLVPGHDNEYSGTEFQGLKEADVNLELTEWLYNYLNNDPRFEVMVTRDFETGNYLPEFLNYFTDNREDIISFRLKTRERFLNLVKSGDIKEHIGVTHNFAKNEVSIRLYGINKWANENDIDLAFHIHVNDYPGRGYNRAGKHTGFSIYIPESQYPNARASKQLAESLALEIKNLQSPSTLAIESDVVIEDQELIALGSQGSRDGAAVLVEYGYIYEPQFINPQIRTKMLPELAWQTYLGMKNYFADRGDLPATVLLPHVFRAPLYEGLKGSADALALQRFLQLKGFYPPTGQTLDDCPVNGNFGPCVKRAVTNFQTANGLPATGSVGELTLTKINNTAI